MKKLTFFAAILFTTGAVYAQSQMVRWTFPGKQANFGFAGHSPVSSALLTSAAPYKTGNSATNIDGSLFLYVVNRSVYTAGGTLIGTLTNPPGVTTAELSPEMAIVPMPGSCKRFYIIMDFFQPGTTTHWLAYAIVNGSLPTITLSQTVDVINDANSGVAAPLGFAVSQLRPDANKRFLYYVAKNIQDVPQLAIVTRLEITASGIGNAALIATPTTTGMSSSTFTSVVSEVDLSPDGTKLAWVSGRHSNVNIIKLDAATGNFVSATYKAMNGGAGYSYGIEWNASSSELYVAHGTGLRKLTYPGMVETVVANASAGYTNTMLERGRDGSIYAVKNTGTSIGKISTSNVVSDNAIPGVTAFGKDYFNNYYILPDQADGEDYQYNLNPRVRIQNPQSCHSTSSGLSFTVTPPYYSSYNWEWNEGLGWNTDVDHSANFFDARTGSGPVQYRVTGSNGACSSPASAIVTVNWCVGTGCCPVHQQPQRMASKINIQSPVAEETVAGSLKITPNPASGVFTVSLQTKEDRIIFVQIYDANGKLVKKVNRAATEASNIKVDCGNLNNGVYFIEAETSAKERYRSRILIQH